MAASATTSDLCPTAGVAVDPKVLETHTALVFFVGDRVYKLKKAADLGFLDHRTAAARHRSCDQEVTLNRRIAPDVYLGVADISGPDGGSCDHLVVMRRLPDDRRLTACIERGEDVEPALRTIVRSITTLHEASVPDPVRDLEATAAAVLDRWVDGFRQLERHARTVPRPERLVEIEDLARTFLVGRRGLFQQRIDDGRIRDGHGDLQADDIFLLPDGPRVLDCLEFGEALRWGDVLSDVAFLAMDLERLGRPDLGRLALDVHRELTADLWPPSLAHHYLAYRAHVRAKVVTLRGIQTGRPAAEEVGRLLDVTLDHLRSAQVRLVLVGGLPGTGKSTVAAALGEAMGAVVLRSDEVRRTTAGLAADYDPASVAAVYDELLDQAASLLATGTSVVLDATWADARTRALARSVASSTSSLLTELRCRLSTAEAARRIGTRRRRGGDPSEATPEVAASMAGRFAPWPEATQLDTSGSPDVVAGRASDRVLGVAPG